jgi:TRAP-type C4-dicarboxylate transport system substrate-binding protein
VTGVQTCVLPICKTRVLFPDDLKQIRLAVDNFDQNAIQIWQRSGFRVTPLNFNDLIAGIHSGMAEATYLTPYAASSIGVANRVPFMLDMQVAPVYALLVISERAWSRINNKYKPQIIQRTEEIIDKFYERIMKVENEGLEIMKRNGLTVVPLTPAAKAEWEKFIEGAVDIYIQQSISPQIHSEVRKYIDEYRRK